MRFRSAESQSLTQLLSRIVRSDSSQICLSLPCYSLQIMQSLSILRVPYQPGVCCRTSLSSLSSRSCVLSSEGKLLSADYRFCLVVRVAETPGQSEAKKRSPNLNWTSFSTDNGHFHHRHCSYTKASHITRSARCVNVWLTKAASASGLQRTLAERCRAMVPEEWLNDTATGKIYEKLVAPELGYQTSRAFHR